MKDREEKLKKDKENTVEKLKKDKDKEIKNNIRNFSKDWKYLELKNYVNALDLEYDIDETFFIKKMIEALLNSNNESILKNLLYWIND